MDNNYQWLTIACLLGGTSAYAWLKVKKDLKDKNVKSIHDLKPGDKNVSIEGHIYPLYEYGDENNIYKKVIRTLYQKYGRVHNSPFPLPYWVEEELRGYKFVEVEKEKIDFQPFCIKDLTGEVCFDVKKIPEMADQQAWVSYEVKKNDNLLKYLKTSLGLDKESLILE